MLNTGCYAARRGLRIGSNTATLDIDVLHPRGRSASFSKLKLLEHCLRAEIAYQASSRISLMSAAERTGRDCSSRVCRWTPSGIWPESRCGGTPTCRNNRGKPILPTKLANLAAAPSVPTPQPIRKRLHLQEGAFSFERHNAASTSGDELNTIYRGTGDSDPS